MFHFFQKFLNPPVKTQYDKWVEAISAEIGAACDADYNNLSTKTQYIEKTLDWAEEREMELLMDNRVVDSVALAAEFLAWSRAPQGFDHELLTIKISGESRIE